MLQVYRRKNDQGDGKESFKEGGETVKKGKGEHQNGRRTSEEMERRESKMD